MLAVLRRRRGLRYLVSAQLVSGLGDELLALALPFFVFELTGSITAAGAVFAASTAAGLLVSPLAGVVVDSFDRRRLLVASSTFSAAAAVGIIIAARHESLLGVYAALFLLEGGARLFLPARSALTPSLASGKDLLAANSLSSLAISITGLAGPALGGVLLATTSIEVVVAIDAASFAAAALLVLFIRNSDHNEARVARDDTARRPLQALAAGARYFAGDGLLRRLVLGGATFAAAIAALNALIVPYTRELLGGGAAAFGLLMTAESVGYLLGALCVGALGIRVRPMGIVAAGMAVDAVCIAALAFTRELWLAAVLLFLPGLATVAALTAIQTVVHEHVPTHLRGRVSGITSPILAIAGITAIAAATTIAESAGVTPVILGSAAALATASLIAATMVKTVTWATPMTQQLHADAHLNHNLVSDQVIDLTCPTCHLSYRVSILVIATTDTATPAIPSACPAGHSHGYAVAIAAAR